MRVLVVILSVTMFAFMVSCEKDYPDESSDIIQVVEYRDYDTTKHKPPRHWEGGLDDPCVNAGTKCAVISATPADYEDIQAQDWESLFENGNRSFGLPDGTVSEVLDGTKEVYPLEVVEAEEELVHLRIK